MRLGIKKNEFLGLQITVKDKLQMPKNIMKKKKIALE